MIMKFQADITPVLFKKDTLELGTRKTQDAPYRWKNFYLLSEWEREHTKVCRSNCAMEDL